MKLQDAQNLCEELMKKNELGKKWRFGWLRAMHTFGNCNWATKTISLSKRFVEVNEEAEVKNTILHEIAHAKCHKRGHNKYWKRWCVKLGARPDRLNSIANSPSGVKLGSGTNREEKKVEAKITFQE